VCVGRSRDVVLNSVESPSISWAISVSQRQPWTMLSFPRRPPRFTSPPSKGITVVVMFLHPPFFAPPGLRDSVSQEYLGSWQWTPDASCVNANLWDPVRAPLGYANCINPCGLPRHFPVFTPFPPNRHSINIYSPHAIPAICQPHPSTRNNSREEARRAKRNPRRWKSIQIGAFETSCCLRR